MNKAEVRSTKHKDLKWLVHLLLFVGAIAMVVPFIWMLLTSVKTLGESTHVPPIIFPADFKWENYPRAFESMPFAKFYWNTIVITAGRTLGQLVTCSLAAYAFARIQFPGRNVLFVFLLSVLMVPPQAYIIPQFLIIENIGWINDLKGIILPGITSVFGTFLLRQFFLTLPKELEEAAKIDGCNHGRIFVQVMVPLAIPGIVALAIFTVLWSWNDLFWPIIVLSSPEKMPLSVGLALLDDQYDTDFPLIMAGTVLAILPMIVLFLALQKQFVEGIALTGTKG